MKKKEKIAAGFLVFLALMWMCTLISKSIYASKLPRVTTALAEKRRIEHVVETDGIIKQGSDVAVHTLPGLRVKQICVRAGDEVEEGSELFWLDQEDLEEWIEAKKLEAAKLEYQIADMKENRALDELERQKGIRRAEEDRETAENKAGTALERAEGELRQTEEKLDSFNQAGPPVTSEEEKQKAYADYNDWVEQGKQMEATVSGNQISVSEKEKYLEEIRGKGSEAEIQKAEADLEEAKKRLAASESSYENYKANPKQQPDFGGEDSAKKAWENEKEALEKNVQSAEYGKEDVLSGNADSLRSADRNLEDANTPGRADSALEIARMELESLKRDIEKYRAIYKAGGKVVSDRSGTVTKVNVTVGERTVDGAAVICADKEVPYQFETLITREQKKYVNQGDTVTLDTPEGKNELEVNYLEEDASGSYRAVVYLPEGKGTLGMSGTMTKRAASESYDCCIPIEALHKEGIGERYYIYLAGEREGILGRERYVEMRYVKVMDRNDSYAALADGEVAKDEEVITGSDKEIENNTVIRVSR